MMNRLTKHIILNAFLILMFMIGTNLHGQDFKQYKWKNRLIVVQASTVNDTKFIEQMNEFVDSTKELKERKLLVFQQINSETKQIDFDQLTKASKGKDRVEKEEQISDSFKLILMGLDGGVKLEKEQIVTMKELIALIDSMPMRAAEMRRNEE